MGSQMVFSNLSGCPEFLPNRMRADLCSSCFKKIQAHSSATDSQISAALEYSVDKIPSLIWEHPQTGAKIYLGGYKAAVNITWLKQSNVSLIVNTARGLEGILGPKYKRQLDERETECPEIEIYNYLINDDLHQELDKDQIINVINRIKKEMQAEKSSVLVHCAQGKSRSTTVVAAFLCHVMGDTVENILAFIKNKRQMAQPNYNFEKQLNCLYDRGLFTGNL